MSSDGHETIQRSQLALTWVHIRPRVYTGASCLHLLPGLYLSSTTTDGSAVRDTPDYQLMDVYEYE
jgi:hypothetical protein